MHVRNGNSLQVCGTGTALSLAEEGRCHGYELVNDLHEYVLTNQLMENRRRIEAVQNASDP